MIRLIKSPFDKCVWQPEVWLPLFLLALFFIFNYGHRIDYAFADFLYALQGNKWAYRDSLLFATYLHQGEKLTSLMIWLLLIVYFSWRRWKAPEMQNYYNAMLWAALSVLVLALLISVVKHFSHSYCPWDLARYGADKQMVTPFAWLFDKAFSDVTVNCFPAGHASAAYAWFPVYFVLDRYRPKAAKKILVLIIGAGIVFGMTQQLRGAHFLSHDVTTAAICWFLGWVLHAKKTG